MCTEVAADIGVLSGTGSGVHVENGLGSEAARPGTAREPGSLPQNRDEDGGRPRFCTTPAMLFHRGFHRTQPVRQEEHQAMRDALAVCRKEAEASEGRAAEKAAGHPTQGHADRGLPREERTPLTTNGVISPRESCRAEQRTAGVEF